MEKVTEKPLFHHICQKIINPSSLAAQGVDCQVAPIRIFLFITRIGILRSESDSED